MRQPYIYAADVLRFGQSSEHAFGMAKKPQEKPRTGRKNYIRQWRDRLGMTQEELGEKIDRSQEQVARIERGDNSYTAATIEAIALALECRAADLISRPPGIEDQVRALVGSLSPEGKRRAVAIIQALKDAEAE